MMSKPNPDGCSEAGSHSSQTPAEKEEERRKIRRLQLMMDTVLSILRQASNLTPEEAKEIVTNCKGAALAMFPDKEFAFDLIYKPRLERVLAERFQESGDRA
jgi:hypothetical protein